MSSFEQTIKQAVEDRVVPPVVLIAGDKEGKLNYRQSHGTLGLDRDNAGRPIGPESVLTWMSLTKLPTVIAVLQLVRRGALPSLDDADADRFAHPLLFEPGTGWSYGPGLDWAGLLLERVVGTSLDAYLREHVWAPLGLRGDAAVPTFFPAPGDGGNSNVVGTCARNPETGRVEAGPPPPPSPGQQQQQQQGACLGGGGLHGTADALARLLASLLADDGAVLERGAAGSAALFEPQLAGTAKDSLLEQLEHPEWITGYIPPNGGEYNWALGGLVVEGDSLVAGRRRGFLMWGGMYNSSWFIDREAGLYGVYATQTLPPGDDKVRDMTKAFQEEMYSRLG
ncbi:beta-lactamase [Magnaporthiopsis poae ATCC 64411]|uniref:Beta-lactamase n=1 Tax=Magnaporthiopsis poae (strain ATCC 64411 / 73-15) TaxID=644358 RepID=A0A0C4DK79_MAGP6|nr:beta-lactamase [Magnaporthiopsis poae ATCC 64411]